MFNLTCWSSHIRDNLCYWLVYNCICSFADVLMTEQLAIKRSWIWIFDFSKITLHSSLIILGFWATSTRLLLSYAVHNEILYFPVYKTQVFPSKITMQLMHQKIMWKQGEYYSCSCLYIIVFCSLCKAELFTFIYR
jgi:hypothetical protein